MGLFSLASEQPWLPALLVAVPYVIYKIQAYRKLSAFKGPPGSGWFELWHITAWLGNNSHLKFKEVCDKYGVIARVGPNDLVTSSREVLSQVNAVRSPYTRTRWSARMARTRNGVDNILSEMNEEIHVRKRHQMAPGYSGKENRELESTMDVYIAKFIHLIRSRYLSTPYHVTPFDIGEKTQFLAVDVINGIGLGESLGDLDNDEDRFEYVKQMRLGVRINSILTSFGFTWVQEIPWIARRLQPKEEDAIGLGRVLRHCRVRIQERVKRGLSERSDMLASFARHGLTTEDLVNEVIIQLIAGADTTSTAIRCLILHVLTHPPVYKKLQDEVDSAVAAGKAPAAPGIITEAAARSLPYLQACIKESLRIHPPLTTTLPKRVPDSGDTVMVDGKPVFLPPGTNVGYSVYALHRDKRTYGEDVDEFRPERWLLEKDEARLLAMNKTHDMIFGYGRYQCLGKPIAQMEISKAIFELMRNFELSLARPENPWKQENVLGLFFHEDLLVHAVDRVQGVTA
ncbi:hypothetical protein VTJ49DRAFT_6634 [Mycothermus thermophilus]|uniref:Pisatin demethylase n=1 Tax=Humicola insolens TaxID=85995 RepID=A0ABR3V1J7_HUMIN